MRTASLYWSRVGLLALLWGSTFLWVRLALDGLRPGQVTVVRCALGALVLTVACLARGQRLPRSAGTWRHIAVAAFFCNALPFTLLSLGQQSVDSGLAGLLNATTPLWSLLISLAAGTGRGPGTDRAAGRFRLGGLLLGFGGVLLIFAPWQHGRPVGWGALAVLGASLSYAVAFGYMRRHLVGRGTPTLALSAAQLLTATALTALMALALPAGGPPPAHPGATALIAVAVLGVLATGVTFHLTYRIIASEGATDAATVGYLLPVVSILLGALVLGEPVGPRTLTGMAVVLAGVATTRLRRTPAPAVAR